MPMAFLLPVPVEGIGRAATGISRKAAPGGGGVCLRPQCSVGCFSSSSAESPALGVIDG